MALDVHLTREVNERWGFELVGGSDEEIPLMVVELQDSSPASRGCLQSGDTIITINGEEALDFTHEDACRRVAECGDSLTFGVMRGRYDPVLDDQEPIYFEPGDLDPELQPTEVPFNIQRFVEPEDLGSSLIDYSDTTNPLNNPYDPSFLLTEARSLTASPYMNNATPYRPFSTEPLPEIPPIEDPIILNADYKDEFGKGLDDIDPEFIINSYNKDDSYNRFKLPISKQYDPDGKKQGMNSEINSLLSKYVHIERLSKASKSLDTNTSVITVNDTKYSNTALENNIICNQSLGKHIKEEISDLSTKDSVTNNVKISDIKVTNVAKTAITEDVRYNEEIKRELDINQIERTAISVVEESINKALSVTDEIKKEIDIELAADVARSSEKIVQKEKDIFVSKSERKVNEIAETVDIKETEFEIIDKIASNKEHLQFIEDNINKERVKNLNQDISQNIFKKEISNISNISESETERKVTESVINNAMSEKTKAQRTYEIGLQTIPNIKGKVHSSYHYDLLLRTFFIHLTDVMVALSRFILSQRVFNTESIETNKTVSKSQTCENDVIKTEHKVVETVQRENNKSEEIKQNKLIVHDKIPDKRVLVTPVAMQHETVKSYESKNQTEQEQRFKSKVVEPLEEARSLEFKREEENKELTVTEEVSEKKTVTGAQMAQRTEKKLTKDMTNKLDAVISEFQSIAVEEDKQEMLQRSRRSRSRSRSQLEEEVAKEKDPLEWLSKVDSHIISQESKESLIKNESIEKSLEISEKQDYKKLEKQEIIRKKAKVPKQMYVAVVESHVYTNKDVILEEVAEFSETSSVQSSEEVNTIEAVDAMKPENVSLESSLQQVQQTEQFKTVEESQLFVTNSHKAASIQNMINESKIQQNVFESKTDFTSSETKIESVSFVEEQSQKLAVDVKESNQGFESVDLNKREDAIESKIHIEDVEEKIDIKKDNEFATLKVIKEVVSEIDSTNEVTEVQELEMTRININEQLHLDKSLISEIDSTKEFSEVQELEMTKININEKLHLDKSLISEEKCLTTSEQAISITSTSETTDINVIETSETYKSEDIIQESTFCARYSSKNLTLDLKTQESFDSIPSTIDTPTPSTIPPTPLTDEYVFQLNIPLPKTTLDIPRDCTLSPEDEDPHIVKKKLIPHIETTVDDKIVYDPPLQTPPIDVLKPIFKTPGLFGGSSKPIYKIKFPPIYRKPGLFGGADNPQYNKEEIRDIEIKSSLLASAIDETIKSIEEYKEEVGIDRKKEVKFVHFKEEKITNGSEQNFKIETIKSQQNGLEDTKNFKETSLKHINNTEFATINGHNNSSDIKTLNLETDFQKHSLKSIQENNTKLDFNQKLSNGINNGTDVIEVLKQTEIKDNKVSEKLKEISKDDFNKEKEMNEKKFVEDESKKDPMFGYRTVMFDPESIPKRGQQQCLVNGSSQGPRASPYLTESGELIGTHRGIVDGLEESVMDPELAKELGKPGISGEKIAELISGESDMLREAHVMGLSRVINSHMNRADDSTEDVQKIKPMIGCLKDSEVLKALNDELVKQREEEKKKDEKKWTTFLQKPTRTPPKAKFGYHGWTEAYQALIADTYKVKIVKQAKPKVAPDYKPEDFETGPLPWELRIDEPEPPADPEEPILVPDVPEYLEAVDPLKETEVPDLEDTGIPLPPPNDPTPPPEIEPDPEELEPLIEEEPEEEPEEEVKEEETVEIKQDMENTLRDQLVKSVQAMVDPNASLDQQLCQMRAQLAALAQLPQVIQQSLELVSMQLNKIVQQETRIETETNTHQEIEVTENRIAEIQTVEESVNLENHVIVNEEEEMVGEVRNEQEGDQVVETPNIEDEIRAEKMQKEQQKRHLVDNHETKPRLRVGNPTRMFGPPDPDSRPVVLPGGRRWRNTSDVYNEQMFAETLQGQAELIQGKALGINFMKYEKPPVSLDHLQNSETYKLVHDMDQPPLRKVDMLKPVIAEADYRERCRSTTPSMNSYGQNLAR